LSDTTIEKLVQTVQRFAPPAAARPADTLAHVWAHELSDEPEPDDQLVEGLIGRGAMSILYGDSNSGKTFFAIHLGCEIASGNAFLGRNIVPGLVVYLATEAPQSVVTRVQAYQRHYGRKVPHLVIVKSPIDLFDGTADAGAVIDLIRLIEADAGAKCQLVIGDTLARMAAGANENSGEDMTTVLHHADQIKREAQVHVMLIHHSGKDAARGARGWSGLRAAIDTEIEVTADDVTRIHAAEITKQRDIPGKGDRIGFKLDVVDLGPGQWDSRRTSCVVIPAEAPAKQAKGKRPSEVAGAIVELMTTHGAGMKKGEIVKHFAERYDRGTVYRELKKMGEAGRVHESAGIVALVKAFTVVEAAA
jgi:putative DNA primase/helicase